MDRRDFLKTVAITGAALTIQRSEAMEVLTQTINKANGSNPDLVAVMGGEPEEMFRRAISELGGMKQFVKPGQKVVVKPNIGWDKVPELAGNTNPKLIEEIVRQCFAAGAKEVVVFDHTCDDWQKCYKNSDPYFVSYPYITVFATITFECKIFMRNIQRNLNRVVSIVQQSGEVGFDVRFVHPVTLFLCHPCMSDRVTVLDYIFAFSKVLQCEFMSRRNVFIQCNLNAIYRKMLSCREVNNGNGDVVGRINS